MPNVKRNSKGKAGAAIISLPLPPRMAMQSLDSSGVHYQQPNFCLTSLKATQITKHLLLLHHSANSIVRTCQTLSFQLEKVERLAPLNCLLDYSMSSLLGSGDKKIFSTRKSMSVIPWKAR